ncbi:hypothetical protein EI94DRAFT_1756479 [Lactarius quietus]|nr:hypothetical protein EI94DRAFT_1756479 [Lactarius quietus]
MDPSQANSREYQLQAIDAEIKSLEESIRALRRRRNALAPVSSLPTEVIATIFCLLRVPVATSPLIPFTFTPGDKPDHLPWLRIAHVCQHWREITLNQPLFWSHLNFTTFSSTGAAEILSRAKTAPLHLGARIPGHWDDARFCAFHKELRTRASYICHLDISAENIRLRKILEGLVSPAPTLEYLSLSCEAYRKRAPSLRVSLPDTLFGGTTPNLSCLELRNCEISWKSPLLKGLTYLEIRTLFSRPSLSVWLDALDEMPRLKMLILYSASPIALPPSLPSSSIGRTITLSSLSVINISASARDCGLALAHLVLPALTRLSLTAGSYRRDGSDVQEILPYVSQHARVIQNTQPLQSMIVRSDRTSTDILAWTTPDIDIKLFKPIAFLDAMLSSSLAFSFKSEIWSPGVHKGIFDAAVAALPLDSLLTFISENRTSYLDKQVWLHHVPRLRLLQRVCLSPSSAHGFTEMLLEDDGGCESPLLPALTKLILVDTELSVRRTFRLCDALMKRVEQGAPLETLDVHACFATNRAVDLLSEIVVDVVGPVQTLKLRPQMVSVWDDAARGIFDDDESSASGIEAYDEDDPGSDDEEWDHWHVDDEDEDEADYW